MKPILLTALFTLLLASAHASQNDNAFKPISSDALIDVDGDGKPDRLFYEIRAWKTEYEGLIRITSAGDKILWEHQHLMMKHDLVNWLGSPIGCMGSSRTNMGMERRLGTAN